ncbi:MAG: sn-glycerol-3-phosphate ABC transporter ATP-binding protein UgpC [Tepidisphaeraceae bacterium]
MARVDIENVFKIYPGNVKAVNDITIHIANGEFIVLVGPSGCGKSTTLRMVAGLEEITGGTIRIGEKVVNNVPPKDRDIAMVFQNYALYPHMSVYKNMAFGLKLRGFAKAEIDKRVQEAARILDITHLLERKPKALSGGQRQRVAVGRAIVREPAAFLFDEPLSNLDAKLRVTTRAEIKRLHQRLKTTTIYVTHDQEEAMTLGDRIVVMKDGVVQQQDTPLVTYNSPANRFVASFIGMPPMNMFDGQLKSEGGRLFFEEGVLQNAQKVQQRSDEPEVYTGQINTPGTGFKMPIPNDLTAQLSPYVGKHVVMGIRPEHFHLHRTSPDGVTIPVKVNIVEPLGNDMDAYVSTALHEHKTVRVEADPSLTGGKTIDLHVDPNRVHVFEPGVVGRNLTIRSTSKVAVA